MEIISLPYKSPLNIFSIDVEDWFHIHDVPSAPSLEKWNEMPSKVEWNFNYLLDILGEYKIKSTCLFLTRVAE